MRAGFVFYALLSLGCGRLPSSKEPSATTGAQLQGHASSVATSALPLDTDPSATPMKLSLVREFPCRVRVFRLRSATIVLCGAEFFSVSARGELVREPKLGSGLGLGLPVGALARTLLTMQGHFPGGAWVVTGEPLDLRIAADSWRKRLFHWQQDRWVQVGSHFDQKSHEQLLAFPWPERGLALVSAKEGGAVAVTTGSARMPQLARPRLSEEDRKSVGCLDMLTTPETWVELTPGDVLVFSGRLCGARPRGASAFDLGFERLRAGQQSTEVSLVPLPGLEPASWTVRSAAALSPNEVALAASGVHREEQEEAGTESWLFAVWNGAKWSVEQPPLGKVARVWAARGAFFATSPHGDLYRRRNGQWSRLAWKLAEPFGTRWSDGIDDIVSPYPSALWIVRHQNRDVEASSWIYRAQLDD